MKNKSPLETGAAIAPRLDASTNDGVSRPRRRERLLALATLALVAALLLAHSLVYKRFVSDDAFISLRYARRFVEGHGLTWTAGERVEGYTDFLWVILISACGWLHGDYLSSALALDHMGAVLAVAMLGRSLRTGHLSSIRLLAGGGLLAASIPVAAWANGALEHGFMTGVLALGLFVVTRRAESKASHSGWVAGLPFAALALLRADGILFAALAVGGALVADWTAPPGGYSGNAEGRFRAPVLRWAPVALAPAVALVAQSLFRRSYYGVWVPNTALAKVAFNRFRLLSGLDYLARGYQAAWVLVGIALVAALVLRSRSRPVVVICLTTIVGWSAYLLVVGGDIFPAWRQLVFVFVPLSFLVGELAERVVSEGLFNPPSVAVVALAIAALHIDVQRQDRENQRVLNEVWEWSGFSIGTMLEEAFSQKDPLHAVDAAGALPYWSNLRSLDMLGLNDTYLAHHPPPNFGHAEIGHELGDGGYVFRRAPDLISFNNAGGDHAPMFLSGRQLVAMPSFQRSYQWIRVESKSGNGAQAEIWVRRDGGKLGIAESADRIEVPGYFLTGPESAAIARLDPQGRLTVAVGQDAYGVLPAFEVPAGRWRMTLDPAVADQASVGFRCDVRSMDKVGSSGWVIELESTRAIAVAIAPVLGARATLVRALIFERTGDEPSFKCPLPGRPVAVALSAVSAAKPENLPWSHPSNFVFGEDGLSASVAFSQRVTSVDVSLDNNDAYSLEFRRGGAVLWKGAVSIANNGGGLAVRHLDVAGGLLLRRGDEVLVAPVNGDKHYSLGFLHLRE
jgi:hypothetical protein